MTFSDVARSGLTEYFRMIQAEVHVLAAPLASEQIWRKPLPYGNSIGNLILHLTGNFNYYVGTQLAGTGYVRQRDQEFTDSAVEKGQLLRNFDESVEIVISIIAAQTDEDWAKPYSAENEPESKDRFTMFLRCAGHAYHHVGQIIYVQRELLGRR